MNEENLIKEISDQSFQQEVTNHDGYVLVDFWAPWCGPCRNLTPVIEKVASSKKNILKVVKINIDDNQQIAQNMFIQSIPTLILFKGATKVDVMKASGHSTEAEIEEWLEKKMVS